MLLTSYNFVLFITVCFVIYYLIPKKFQWMLLLAASYVFYFMAGAFYPLFLLATSVITYGTAIWIGKCREKDKEYLAAHKAELSREEKKAYRIRSDRVKRRYMLLGLLLCLGILAVFKYTDFVIENLNMVLLAFGSENEFEPLELLLPMGISFYTFQSIGYLLDVYWERTKIQSSLPRYILFVSFFPQLIQGPISRYSDLSKTLYEEHVFDWRNVRFGLERILWGYFKKLVIADTILPVVAFITEDEYYGGAWVLMGIIFYGIELYADFTGGIDIVIGVAQLFGVKVQENFRRPFFSKSIVEYWRRWHISMGAWFRDYLFYPMSISKTMNTLTKVCKNRFGKGVAKRVPVYLATMVTWFATGIWHGASWNFIVWGLLNGVIILITGELEPLYVRFREKFPRFTASTGYRGFQVVRTFFLMGSLRMLDCYQDVGMTFRMFISMFRNFNPKALTWEEIAYFGLDWQQYLVVFAGVAVMFLVSLAGRSGSVREKIAAKPYVVRYGLFVALFLSVILFGSYGVGFEAAQFIYNQF